MKLFFIQCASAGALIAALAAGDRVGFFSSLLILSISVGFSQLCESIERLDRAASGHHANTER